MVIPAFSPASLKGLLFAAVVLVGSFLLFMVQPMVARLALPLLGGAPGVWNSAMMVFQLLLLGGYAYAHALSRMPFRRQAAIHLALLLAAALTLPTTLAEIPRAPPGWEVLWVPLLFVATIGPIFLLLSAQASLMQLWYAADHEAGNPYRLYAASNLGSFGGLMAYPFLIEPEMALGEQSWLWAAGYLALIVLTVLAAAARWNTVDRLREELPEGGTDTIGWRRVLLWLGLAAVPSGLTLSTTTLLTTDLMAMPLLWVIPLGLYLLSFSLAFSDSGDWTRILTNYAPVLLLLVGGLAMISGGQANPALALAMVALLFVIAVALHGRLYALRPQPRQLTFFYLIVAAGGALGGIFVALVAPVLFDWIYEHPILLLGAALLLPQKPLIPLLGRLFQGRRSAIMIAIVLAASAILAWQLAVAVQLGLGTQILVLVSTLVVLGLVLIGRRWAFTAVFALLMLGHGGLSTMVLSVTGDRSRSYFGVYSVQERRDGLIRRMTHGTTMHGEQWLDPDRRDQPTAYYGESSGAGIALADAEPDARVGAVGLGVGTLACYRKPGQEWTFFEIDPAVVRYSRDGSFTFLDDCAPDARIVIGDARLELAEVPAGRFDVLVLDAFTSDAIPMHLITEEAFDTYDRALAEDGLLLVHISNRFIDLAPMISALAESDGWSGRMRKDFDDLAEGLTASNWIALSRDESRLEELERATPHEWEGLAPPARRAFTDDNASIIPLIRF